MAEEQPYTKWQLYKWSVLVRQRDEMVCFMCKRDVLKRSQIHTKQEEWLEKHGAGECSMGEMMVEFQQLEGLQSQSHHIEPKFHCPERALDLSNGVCLCWRCHRRVVHSTYETYKIYRHAFSMYNRRRVVREYNEENQERL